MLKLTSLTLCNPALGQNNLINKFTWSRKNLPFSARLFVITKKNNSQNRDKNIASLNVWGKNIPRILQKLQLSIKMSIKCTALLEEIFLSQMMDEVWSTRNSNTTYVSVYGESIFWTKLIISLANKLFANQMYKTLQKLSDLPKTDKSEIKIARIANAVQVTLWLSITNPQCPMFNFQNQ